MNLELTSFENLSSYNEIYPGAVLYHKEYGKSVVISIADGVVTLWFADGFKEFTLFEGASLSEDPTASSQSNEPAAKEAAPVEKDEGREASFSPKDRASASDLTAFIDSMKISESRKIFLRCIAKLSAEGKTTRQKDIAEALGYTSGTVSVAVDQLLDMGFISINDGMVTLNDLQALEYGELQLKQLSAMRKKYLYSIARLGRNGDPVRKVDVAKDLKSTRAAVTTALRKLEEDGFVMVDVNGYLSLNSRVEPFVLAELPSSEEHQPGKKERDDKPAFDTDEASQKAEREPAAPANVSSHQDRSPQRGAASVSLKPIAYGGNEPFIFVSYSHKDKEAVYRLIWEMADEGFRVWYDEGIEPGTGWDDNVASHVENCALFLVLMSPNYLASENCRDELNFARDEGKRIVIVYLENTDLPSGMKLRLSRLYALHRYEMLPQDFYRKLLSISDIDTVREKQ